MQGPGAAEKRDGKGENRQEKDVTAHDLILLVD